jgi:GGDEF domain-containing protein
MIERRTDPVTRKRVADMSPEEMRRALLVSEKTGLPNKRAFDETESSPFVAMIDVNGLKALNDEFGYSAGDMLIQRVAEVLIGAGLNAYHDKGDEFLCTGKSHRELRRKLAHAQTLLSAQRLPIEGLDGRVKILASADFCYGIGPDMQEAERSLKHQKELRKLTR